jgi:hypothetical protein
MQCVGCGAGGGHRGKAGVHNSSRLVSLLRAACAL